MTSTIGICDTIFYAYINNEKYKIKIVDTAGQENYRSIVSSYIKGMMDYYYLLMLQIKSHLSH